MSEYYTWPAISESEKTDNITSMYDGTPHHLKISKLQCQDKFSDVQQNGQQETLT